jgi:hypothetical protein
MPENGIKIMVTRYKYHGYKVHISWLQGIDIMVTWYKYHGYMV